MSQTLNIGDRIRVPDDRFEETFIEEVYDDAVPERMKNHRVNPHIQKVVAADPNDNLIVYGAGAYHFWDAESEDLIRLGAEVGEFLIEKAVD